MHFTNNIHFNKFGISVFNHYISSEKKVKPSIWILVINKYIFIFIF
mgnify:CR=1 FL=1